MRVNKLKLEDIQVESYATDAGDGERGTVNANEDVLGTGIVKCGTNFGPNCETQKMTRPCSIC